MSGELIVAVVSVVMAGFAGPIITAAATTSGQKRKFIYEQRTKDRDEVRALLDEALEALDLLEVSAERLGAGYVQHGSAKEAYEELFKRATDASRILAQVKARLAIRLGSNEPIDDACTAALQHAEEISGAVARYLTVGPASPEPRSSDIQNSVKSIDEARTTLVLAAFEVVGASLND